MRPNPERGTFVQSPEVYGSSHLGQRLEWWPAAERTDVLIVGGVHGEEPDTSVMLSRALRVLPHPPRRTSIVVAANPDGLIRGTRGNARGVDLNRNFPTGDWRPGTVTHRWTNRHESEVLLGTGDSPASEPEIQALIRLVEELRPAQLISLHGHLACIEDPAATSIGRWVSERSGLPLVDSVGYHTPGSMGTWAAEIGIPIITWELPPDSIESMFHSQLPVIVEILEGRHPGIEPVPDAD